ncbi:nitrate- and nitrite sensing domain-containing protein [Actinacidiphila sp. ITFR-21]|uniref:nitrate- and nitrite sensing domain-containing protein n=1 Tax=Actinacidiphila sp. ITFR-21 TaxID=3075199 RepID=UPI00288A0456|nr:nitrate- and nitrite sensing domain-containing protein [Streptomyces sp. ITFR-21]WNI17953.1 nitrate- and nitrite sensing domain-containing protein [Streptomyces sp. ITFR-21]
MLAALLGCAAALLAAATPGVALAGHDLSAAQEQVDAARLAARAVVLAHDLADERDDAAIRAGGGPVGRDRLATDRSNADRQARDVAPGAPAEVRTALAALPAARAAADSGKGGPQAVVAGYQPLIDALGRLCGPVTAPLGRAVDAAARQRGLLVGALAAGGSRRGPVAAAQAAHLQEQAALADFRATAPAALRARYDQTVNGADAAAADRDLAELLDGPALTGADRGLGADATDRALTARLALMRSVEASAAADEARRAADHRDHQVTVLELRVALVALCLILFAGVLVSLFRSVTRPLAALHRWSRADGESGQGARVLGRDEFAAVARRANALTQEAQALRARVHELAAERDALSAAHNALTAERDGLLRTRDDLLRSREELAGRFTEASARNAAHVTYVNLGLRTLGLVERQLALIEALEDREQEPERLDQLFRLDHLATRMRRNSENLLVLTGTEHSHGATARPVALVDVARAAISEVERYERVHIQTMPDVRVAGRAADDISHLIAELLDNATGFSAPAASVHLSGWLLENGEVMLSVEDSGIGMPDERLNELNELLADPRPAPPGTAAGMGLYVVARLAQRHGVRTQLRPQAVGGTAAVVVLPQRLLPAVDPQEPPATPIEAALAGAQVTGRRAAPAPGPDSGPDTAPAAARSVPQPFAGPAAVPQDRPSPLARRVPAGQPVQAARPAQPAQPEQSARAAEAVRHDRAGPEAGAGGEAPATRRLPQRVPRPAGMGDVLVQGPRRPRGGPVDAAELRRKLGGLQRGLQAGRRDAEHEISAGTGPTAGPAGAADQPPRPRTEPPAPQRPATRRHAAPGPPAPEPLPAAAPAQRPAPAPAPQPPPAAWPVPQSAPVPEAPRVRRSTQGDTGEAAHAGPADSAEEATR